MSAGPARDGEHRTHRRYPLHLDLRCTVARSVPVFLGKTVDISGGGVCFSCSEFFFPGQNVEVELAIDWPIRLHGTAPLQLKVTGRIVRQDKRGTAIEILRHEFHTRKAQAHPDQQARPLNVGVA